VCRRSRGPGRKEAIGRARWILDASSTCRTGRTCAPGRGDGFAASAWATPAARRPLCRAGGAGRPPRRAAAARRRDQSGDRHPALTAWRSASRSIRPRAPLGIGRGDSACRNSGLRAARSAVRLYVPRLQAICGDIVEMDGKGSSLEWLRAIGPARRWVTSPRDRPGVIAPGAAGAGSLNLGATPSGSPGDRAGRARSARMPACRRRPVFGAYLPSRPSRHPRRRQLVKRDGSMPASAMPAIPATS